MHFIPFFETVICFSCPKFCSVQKDDIISEDDKCNIKFVLVPREFNQEAVLRLGR